MSAIMISSISMSLCQCISSIIKYIYIINNIYHSSVNQIEAVKQIFQFKAYTDHNV